jgi:hypothetical protein
MIQEEQKHVGMGNYPIKYPLTLLIGLIIGFLLNDCQRKTTEKIVIETVTTTDTVFVEVKDTITVTKLKHIYHKDTTFLVNNQLITAPLQSFSETFNVLYGSVSVEGEVAGKVTRLGVITDFNFPTVTNNITTTKTITKKPTGLYITVGLSEVDKQLSPLVGGVFVRDRYLINYSLGLNGSLAQIGYRLGR